MFQIGTPVHLGAGSVNALLALGDGKFVIAYTAGSNRNCVIASVDGSGVISFGTPAVAHSSSGYRYQLCPAGAGKFMLLRLNGGQAAEYIIGTVTGTSIAFGTAATVGPSDTGIPSCCWDPVNQKVIVVDAVNDVHVGTVSGSSVSWGSPVDPPTATYYDYITRLYFDPNSGKVIYYGCYFAGGYGGYEEDLRNELHVGTVSGTSISFGATTTFEPFVYFEDLAFADDPVSGKPVIAYRWVDSIYDSGGKASSLTVSGTSVTVDTPDVLAANVSGGIGLATDTADNAVVATFGGSGTELDFAAGTVDGAFAFTEVDVDQTLTIDSGSPRLLAYDPDTDYALTVYRVSSGGSQLYTATVDYSAPADPVCYRKPIVQIVQSASNPGDPGHPGQPYVPGYCIPGPCIEVTSNNQPDGVGGVFSQQCTTYSGPNDDLGLGFGETQILCNMIYLPAEQTSGLGTIYSSDPVTEVICSPPICYPPQPYIAPTPAAAPTQAVYAIEYDLGWNHDVVLASGSGLSLDITVDNVARDTAGVVIGVADLADTSYEGLGKYDAYLLFEGTNVSVYEGGTRVWGAVYRAAGDVFTLQQVDTQVAVLRNGVVIYVGDLLKTTQAVFIATIYKGGEGVCFVVPPTTSGALAVGTAGADATLPALIALGGLYAQAEILLPAPTLEAYGYGHGGADIDLPALFGIGAEGSFGWAMLRLPAPSAVGYAADAGINHADLDLPPLGVLAGVGTYAFGDAKLPALAGGGSGGFVSPVSQGADLDLPHLILGALGYTGGIGGANLTLPAIDGLASEDAYGEVDVTLPALRTFAGELPDYDGVLYGRLSGLEVVDFWGYQNAPDAVIGRLGPLVGSLYGGANLDGALASLSGALTGTLEVVGRISGTLAELGGALHALVGATATLDRPLGLGLRGELFGGAQLDGELPALRGASSGDLDTIGTINGTFVLSGSLSGTHEDYGRLSGSIGELGALWGVLDGVIVALDGELVASQVTVAEYAAWVMNLAHNGLSRYPAYPFDFVVRWQRRHYLANSAGLYLLGGDNDDGANINAGFALPESDYGTAYEKRVPRFYFKGKVAGELAVTASVDEGDRVARHTDGHEGVDYWRVRLPRGLEGHHWKFEVANVDGADFEIEQTDVLIHKTGRKL